MSSHNPIKVDIDEAEREQMLLECLWIIKNLREKKILWERHYGGTHRKALATWEDKADKLLEKLNIEIEQPDPS